MATDNYTFYPRFEEYVTLFRGVVHVWIGTGDSAHPGSSDFPAFNDPGILYAQYVDDKVQNLGPVSSYAEAVQAGVAGPGTQFPTPEDWLQHIIDTTQHALDSEAWAVGQEIGVDVPSTHPTYHNNSKWYAGLADASRVSADEAKTAAETARDTAAEWATGGATGTPTGTNNSKYYSEQSELFKQQAEAAKTAAETAQNLAEVAQGHAEDEADDAEAWAVGTVDGSAIPSTDPRYQNNSKYWSEQSAQSAAAASSSEANAFNSESNAAQSEDNAEAWAVGQRNTDPTYENNSKYYAEPSAGSATAAATSEANAATSETNAENSAQLAQDNADAIRGGVMSVSYQNSNSGITPPSGTWTNTPDPQNGKYLWAKIELSWADTGHSTYYTVTYVGVNGTGSVDSVNNKGGDVILYGDDISLTENDPTKISTKFAEIDQWIANAITNAQIDALFQDVDTSEP